MVDLSGWPTKSLACISSQIFLLYHGTELRSNITVQQVYAIIMFDLYDRRQMVALYSLSMSKPLGACVDSETGCHPSL